MWKPLSLILWSIQKIPSPMVPTSPAGTTSAGTSAGSVGSRGQSPVNQENQEAEQKLVGLEKSSFKGTHKKEVLEANSGLGIKWKE